MSRRLTGWRLFWAMAAAVALAAISAGMLWGAERTRKAAPKKTPAKAAPKAPAKPAVKAEPAMPALPEPAEGIEIVSPESGSKLRGIATVRVGWNDSTGYVIYRVDGQFAYATTSPYEMRWDSSATTDDEHVLTADAYDSSGAYQGTSSIKVVVENAIPTPPEGVLLQVKFKEDDLFTRRFQGRSEIGALSATQMLPPGFDVLGGDLRCDLTQSVMDTFYEGNSTLVRNRVREGSITVGGTRANLPETGQYAMVQISRNGLTVPATAAVTRPRIGLGEVSLALPDIPVFPGDQWESPIGVVFDVYTRRVVFVQGQHTFEGLRWFRGRECAVVTSSYSVARLALYETSGQQTASAAGETDQGYRMELTGAVTRANRGRRMGAGGMGPRAAGGRAGARATGARPSGAATPGQATGARGAAGLTLESAVLTEVNGTRRTYLTTVSGRVLHTEDTITGKVDFRAGGRQTAARGESGYSVELTGATGGVRRGARRAAGEGMRARGRAAAQRQPRAGQASRATQPGRAQTAAPAGTEYPPSLQYALTLTGDLVIQ